MSLGDIDIQDKELQEFLSLQQQRVDFQRQVNTMTEMCWEKCMDKPSSRLDSKTESCAKNCVDRFLDTSIAVSQRFSSQIQKKLGNLEDE